MVVATRVVAAAAAPPPAKKAAATLLCRRKMLDAIRGIPSFLNEEEEEELKVSNNDHKERRRNSFPPLKCFRLEKHHIGSFVRKATSTAAAAAAHHRSSPPAPASPADFHATLCQRIRQAKRRVMLASLYIGPAAANAGHGGGGGGFPNHGKSPPPTTTTPAGEYELLQALQQVAAAHQEVQVTILLDRNRALRHVPTTLPDKTTTTTTTTTTLFENKQNTMTRRNKFISSAQACFEALHHGRGTRGGGGGDNCADGDGGDSPSGCDKDSGDENHSTDDSSNTSSNNNNKIYLFSVLPDFWQSIFGSLKQGHALPISEAAGVFHVKVYIMDDELILSGANLSEEYFTNRHDRYLYIVNGGNGLVDCYAQLVDALCQYAQEYNGSTSGRKSSSGDGDDINNSNCIGRRRIGAQELMHLVTQVLTTTSDSDCNDYTDLYDDEDITKSSTATDSKTSDNDSACWAYAVPTFQAPLHFQQEQFMRSDVETIRNWIQSASAAATPADTGGGVTLHLASAYLNPTKSFQAMLQRCCRRNLDAVHYLTAGRMSHGFTSKPVKTTSSTETTTTTTTDHPRRDWIPTLFDATARQVLASSGNDNATMKKSHLWFYQRPNWTFHAKGLWLCSSRTTSINNNNPTSSSSRHDRLEIDEKDQALYGCTHGSGNYGARSEYRDLESNLILVFPPRSPLAKQHVQEWNSMCSAAVPWTQEPKQQMSWPLRLLFPWIRSFF